MEVVDEVEELPNLPAKMLGNHHLKSYILHSIDVVGHQHVIRTLGQGRIQIDFSIYTADIKHGLKGAWEEAVRLIKSLVIPKGDNVATVPRISFQLLEKLIDNIVFLNDCPVRSPIVPVSPTSQSFQ